MTLSHTSSGTEWVHQTHNTFSHFIRHRMGTSNTQHFLTLHQAQNGYINTHDRFSHFIRHMMGALTAMTHSHTSSGIEWVHQNTQHFLTFYQAQDVCINTHDTFSHLSPHSWNNFPQDIRHSATPSSSKTNSRHFSSPNISVTQHCPSHLSAV